MNHTTAIRCPICFHHCRLTDGQTGICLTRQNKNGRLIAAGYGKITSLALDPIEKKPLFRFYPNRPILSVGSFGCNLACPFCQNHEISQTSQVSYRMITPEELIHLALELKESHNNIGIAFTYNEPLLNYEYIIDCGKLAKPNHLDIVLVTNGTAEADIISRLLPFVSAMNIDVKAFSEDAYRKLGGDLKSVKQTVALASKTCHIELTTLIVEGINDDCDLFRNEIDWIASIDEEIPLHITRSFPRYQMTTIKPTPVAFLQELKQIAEEKLRYVYLGNV